MGGGWGGQLRRTAALPDFPLHPFFPRDVAQTRRLSADDDQNARCDRENSHQRTQSREAEIEQRYQSGQDEPDGQQQHADIARHFHGQTPCDYLRALNESHCLHVCKPFNAGAAETIDSSVMQT